jgi:catechol-2,3-dioxygenase
MVRIVKLGHAAIYARDKARLQSFYRDVMGMKVMQGDGHDDVTRLGFGEERDSCDLSIVSHPKDVRMTFLAAKRADLATFRQKLANMGVPISELAENESGVSFLFSDPEGNRIEMAWTNGT